MLAVSFSACSDGGIVDRITTTTTTTETPDANTTSPETNVMLDGKAIDGEIMGATVCIDVNANDRCDPEEDSTTTDNDGVYNLDSLQAGNLLLIGGQDKGTGKVFTGSLKAPAGSAMVTPLTSMVQELVESGSTAAEAETILKKALGIPASISLTTFDPFEQADAGNEEAKSVLAAQAQIQTLVHAASASVAGVGEATSIADSMSGVTASLAKSLKAAVEVAEETGASTVVGITIEMLVKAIKDSGNREYASYPAAQVAVKAVAEKVALETLVFAEQTKENIENSSIADAKLALNIGMVLANK